MHSKMVCTLAGAALCFGMSAAQAAQWNFNLTGTVVYADVPNDYNLVDNTGVWLGNSTVTVAGIFDDSSLTNGTGVVSFAPGNAYGNTFTVTAGDITFTPDESIIGTPTLTLDSMNVDFAGGGLSFYATDTMSAATFNAYFDAFDGDDHAYSQIAGNWTNSSVTAVPEAETYAMMLAGLGLVGWMGARRKARTA